MTEETKKETTEQAKTEVTEETKMETGDETKKEADVATKGKDVDTAEKKEAAPEETPRPQSVAHSEGASTVVKGPTSVRFYPFDEVLTGCIFFILKACSMIKKKHFTFYRSSKQNLEKGKGEVLCKNICTVMRAL